jgi:hypothetical protein
MTMFAGLNVGFKRSGWGIQECLAGSCRHPPPLAIAAALQASVHIFVVVSTGPMDGRPTRV